MSILLPHFITPFWVAVRGKANLKILELVSPYSEKPKVRHVSDFNLYSCLPNTIDLLSHLPVLDSAATVGPTSRPNSTTQLQYRCRGKQESR